MDNKNQQQEWDANHYHLHSSIQFEASGELLKNIQFKGDECILDIGCGDGKITASISKLIPEGKILGIDLSPAMISFANNNFSSKEYENLRFQVKDANHIKFNEKFDVIFACFSLHWISNFEAFISRVSSVLKTNGLIIFTIPLGISRPLHQATIESMQRPCWAKFFIDYIDPYPDSKINTYKNAIDNSTFEFRIFEKVNHKKIFDSRESLENYIIQWYPFLNYLLPSSRKTFFRDVINRYIEIEPLMNDGSVIFEFPRLDIIARKL
jgi:trans-aconitate 2-methyltransferase